MTTLSLNRSNEFISLFQGASFIESQERKKPHIFLKISAFLICRNLSKDIIKVNNFIRTEFDSILDEIKSTDKEKAQKTHAEIKFSLDSFIEKHSNIKPTWVTSSLINPLKELMENLKVIEMHLRVHAYPERNEIPLSYDELKELNSLLSGWECVSEQNDICHSNHH